MARLRPFPLLLAFVVLVAAAVVAAQPPALQQLLPSSDPAAVVVLEGSGTELAVRWDPEGRRNAAQTMYLYCDEPISGAVPKPRLACAQLTTNATLVELLQGAPEPARACTMIYGGPDWAELRGTINGRVVRRELTRTDGCAISEWDLVARAGLIPQGAQ